MARTRTVTKQVKFAGNLLPASYTQNRDGTFTVMLITSRRPKTIDIDFQESSGRGPFERKGFRSVVGTWESPRFPTPKGALAAACKMIRSNG